MTQVQLKLHISVVIDDLRALQNQKEIFLLKLSETWEQFEIDILLKDVWQCLNLIEEKTLELEELLGS